MLLPADLDLDAPRSEIVARLVRDAGYEPDAAELVADALLEGDDLQLD